MDTLQILYHGNCFDGVVSSAIFWRFFRDAVRSDVELVTRGMAHGRRDPYGEDHDATMSGDVNAVLDFRYSPSSNLTWFCDHHHTTFIRPEHQAHFEADRSGRKHLDVNAPSCGGLLSRWLAAAHGYRNPLFVDHARWTDLIDSAAFDSPAQAVELAEPALQLTTLLESAPGQQMCHWLIEQLSSRPLDEVHAEPRVTSAVAPLLDKHRANIDLFRRRLELVNGVATADLSGDEVEGFNKFIPYHLLDGVRYTVILTQSDRRAKVSVGSNPWQRPEPLENLGELCRTFGGGGHAVVGAVTLEPEAVDDARAAYHTIVEKLRAS